MQGIENTPKKYDRGRESFKKMNPGWQFKEWDEEQMRKIASPRWLRAIQMCQKMIQRADILRCVILEEFGGVYVDMDMVCLQSLDRFVEEDNVQAGYTSFHNTFLNNLMGGVNNGILFSPRKHAFWQNVFLPELLKRLQQHTLLDDLCPAFSIIRTTGPLLWTQFEGIIIHPQVFFYSLAVLKKKEIGDEDIKILKDVGAYVYHAQDSLWLHSWEKYLMLAFMGRGWIYTLSIFILLIFIRGWFWKHRS